MTQPARRSGNGDVDYDASRLRLQIQIQQRLHSHRIGKTHFTSVDAVFRPEDFDIALIGRYTSNHDWMIGIAAQSQIHSGFDVAS